MCDLLTWHVHAHAHAKRVVAIGMRGAGTFCGRRFTRTKRILPRTSRAMRLSDGKCLIRSVDMMASNIDLGSGSVPSGFLMLSMRRVASTSTSLSSSWVSFLMEVLSRGVCREEMRYPRWNCLYYFITHQKKVQHIFVHKAVYKDVDALRIHIRIHTEYLTSSVLLAGHSASRLTS